MHTDEEKYAQMGIAALLPGMQHMVDVMQAELNRMREQLAHLQNGHGASRRSAPMMRMVRDLIREKPKRQISAAGRAAISAAQRNRWAAMKDVNAKTAEERTAELSAARKAQWAGLSKAKRKARLAKMLAGRQARKERAAA